MLRQKLSRLMQTPLEAAFARKVLRCKARDEGRTLVLFDEARNAAAGHFSCKPFGAVLGGAICFVASLANSPAIRLRLASRISPRQAAPRPHGVLHQPANASIDFCSRLLDDLCPLGDLEPEVFAKLLRRVERRGIVGGSRQPLDQVRLFQ